MPATGKHTRGPSALRAQARVSDRKDPTMDAMQRAADDALVDGSVSNAQRAQLCERYHAVLACCEVCQLRMPGGLSTFPDHMSGFVDWHRHVARLPTAGAPVSYECNYFATDSVPRAPARRYAAPAATPLCSATRSTTSPMILVTSKSFGV